MSRSLRLAILVPPFVGHLNPMLALGRTLARRGHEVTVLSFADAEPRVRRGGLPLVTFGGRRFGPGQWNARIERIAGLTGKALMRAMLGVVLDHGKSVTEDLPGLLGRERYDGLVVDQFCYGAEAVAEATGTPMALGCAALPFHRESRVPLFLQDWPYDPSWRGRLRNQAASFGNILWGWRMSVFYMVHRTRLGLWPPGVAHMNEMAPSLVQVAQVPRCLDFPRHRLPDHFHYTAPWVDGARSRAESGAPGFPWERLDGRPLIYASLGTLQNGVMGMYETIAAACAGMEWQLVLALGREATGELPVFAGQPVVAGYAPQLELLPRASLVITHAGLNTTVETARAGVPMVAIPISHDQPGVASRIRHHGLGQLVPLCELTPERLRTAVREVAGNPAYRERARAVARELEGIDGPEVAADLLEEAFATRARVRRRPDGAGNR